MVIYFQTKQKIKYKMSSKAEELAASLESGEMGDEKYLGGTGG